MRMALTLYRKIHLQYLWLHFLVALVFILTSVFWFVLPYFIISYGTYTPSIWLQSVLLAALYTISSLLLTLHCWFINFQVAKKWQQHHPDEKRWHWLLRFQMRTFMIAITYTAIIYSLLLVIDHIR